MNATLMLIVASVVGVDVGWQTRSDGTLEYIIQIEPELLDSLLAGGEIISDVPPALRGMGSYRIRIGSGALPHDALPEDPAEDTDATDEADPAETPVDSGDETNHHSAESGAAVTNNRPPLENLSRWPDIEAPRNFDVDTDPGTDADPPDPTQAELDEFDIAGNRSASVDKSPQSTVPNRFDIGAEKLQPVQPAGNFEASESPSPNHGDNVNDDAADDSQDAGSPAAGSSGLENWPQMLILAVIGLFVSLGANLYLGWITWALRSRYRDLAEIAAMRRFATPRGE